MKAFTKSVAMGLIILCTLNTATATTASASVSQAPTILINGSTVHSTVAPYIDSGTTMVPLRVISERLGAQVDWNANTRGITINKDGSKVELTVGNKVGKINGSSTPITVAPTIISGSTMVPLRFIGEALNCSVKWDASTKTVVITTDGTSEVPQDQYGRTIRTTNLPSNAKDFPYIVEGIPNWVYEKQELIRQNNIWSGYHTTWGDGSETNHKGYTAADLYDGGSSLFPQNMSYGLYDKVNEYINLTTNVDYKTIDYTWADKIYNLIIPSDMAIFVSDIQDNTSTAAANDVKEYLKLWVDMVKDHKTSFHCDYELLPETLWTDYNNNLHVSAYVKFTLDETQTPKCYQPVIGITALAKADNLNDKPFEVGKTYEGVWTLTIQPVDYKVAKGGAANTDYRIVYSKSGFNSQIHPSVNITDSVAPGTEDTEATKSFYYAWQADYNNPKAYGMYDIPKDDGIGY